VEAVVVRSARLLLLGPIALLAGLAVGALAGPIETAQSSGEVSAFNFPDGTWAFCSGGDRLNVEDRLVDEDPEAGYSTTETALMAYLEELRSAVRNSYSPSVELEDELSSLLAPALEFEPTTMLDVGSDITYFDTPSTEAGFLEARIVVERIAGAFRVTSSFICETQVVSDPARLEELLYEMVSK
jgi:hypothetical protein